MSKKDELELAFLGYCDMFKLPPPEREYYFHKPRMWRFDFAWPERMVAVEIEGGTWVNGGHTRGAAYTKNCEKYNQAALDGWTLLRFTTDMMRNNPAGMIEQVKLALEVL